MAQDRYHKVVSLTIAGIGITAHTVSKDCRMFFPAERDPLLAFTSEGVCDTTLSVHAAAPETIPEFSIERKVFSTENTWSLYELKDGRLLFLDVPSSEETFERAAVMSRDLSHGDIYVLSRAGDAFTLHDPLSYPLDQILMISLLGRRRGILVHSCGAVYKGAGLLFAGSSGSGKTTTANLLNADGEFTILNDDRVAVREKNGAFTIYGTPWHGTARFARADMAPLKKVYFLRHGRENKITPLSQPEAAGRLFAALFPAFWHKESSAFSLGLCARLAERIPFFELSFLPTRDITGLIKDSL